MSLIVALCAAGAFGIMTAYTHLTGTVGAVVPLLIVVVLIVFGVGTLEILGRQHGKVPESE